MRKRWQYALLMATQGMYLYILGSLGAAVQGSAGFLFWFLVPPLMAFVYGWRINLAGSLLLLLFPNLLVAVFGKFVGFDLLQFNLLALPTMAIALFVSNKFYLWLTIVGLVAYIGIYFVMPSNVDEKLSLAMYAPEMPPVFGQLTDQPGTGIKLFDVEADLRQAVLDGDYQAGVALPADIMQVWGRGGKPKITVIARFSLVAEAWLVILRRDSRVSSILLKSVFRIAHPVR